jgi:hypothetical protein
MEEKNPEDPLSEVKDPLPEKLRNSVVSFIFLILNKLLMLYNEYFLKVCSNWGKV